MLSVACSRAAGWTATLGSPGLPPILLLVGSNLFMTLAWYGHLRFTDRPLWLVIIVSWGIALFEYCLQVPGNRIGFRVYNPAQLKTIQAATASRGWLMLQRPMLICDLLGIC